MKIKDRKNHYLGKDGVKRKYEEVALQELNVDIADKKKKLRKINKHIGWNDSIEVYYVIDSFEEKGISFMMTPENYYIYKDKDFNRDKIIIETYNDKGVIVEPEEAKEIVKEIKDLNEVEKRLKKTFSIPNAIKTDYRKKFVKNILYFKDKWKLRELKTRKMRFIKEIPLLMKEEVDNKKEEEHKKETIRERWNKDSYYEDSKKDYKVNKNYLKKDSLEIEITENFDKVFKGFYDTKSRRWDCSFELYKHVLDHYFKKYMKERLNEDIEVQIRQEYGEFTLRFEEDKNGIYFEDKRIRQSKFNDLKTYIWQHREVDNDDIRENLNTYNKVSAIKRKVVNMKEIMVMREIDENFKITLSFDFSDKNSWMVNVDGNKYKTDWNTIKEYFSTGRKTKNDIRGYTLMQFLDEVGEENTVETFKDMVLVAKIG